MEVNRVSWKLKPVATDRFFIKLNPFPNNKILDMIKLKAFADNKFNMAKKDIFSLW